MKTLIENKSNIINVFTSLMINLMHLCWIKVLISWKTNLKLLIFHYLMQQNLDFVFSRTQILFVANLYSMRSDWWLISFITPVSFGQVELMKYMSDNHRECVDRG